MTLMVAGCFVAALAGLLLVGAWAQRRGTLALLWWGAAHLSNAVAAALLLAGMTVAAPVTVIVGTGGIVLSMSLYWSGARVFFHRRPSLAIGAVAMLAWLAVTIATASSGPRPSVAAAFLATAVLLGLAAAELARASEERIGARWGLIAVFVLHAVVMAIGAYGLGFGNLEIVATPSVFSWFGAVHFERLVFLIGSALFMVVMARERQEMITMSAARIDSLTGVANRGAFFTQAGRILRRARDARAPVSLIVFDLDYFKRINDSFGHAAGDRVLRTFADTATAMLRPADLLGRIGGEEFAALLPGVGTEAAYVIAERIRHAFESASSGVGSGVRATVSAGTAVALPGAVVETVLEEADRALYRAKANGRNRVERAIESAAHQSDAKVIRVA
jgi:diguanylate cyclase (GGDEF)-like protein